MLLLPQPDSVKILLKINLFSSLAITSHPLETDVSDPKVKVEPLVINFALDDPPDLAYNTR
jgi:hypothetical protein